MNEGIIAQVFDFFAEIFAGLDSGYLFFGGPADIIRYIFDILLITFLTFQLIKLLRQTRAWQLLQGLSLIVIFTMVCSLLGLEMVSFLFNRMLYVIAIAFVVIFQPELRRALETVGLKSFSKFSSAFIQDDPSENEDVTAMIDNIVYATNAMAKTYTGALIIIERNSKLGELLEQENVVFLDSSVNSPMLESIFYKGSPLHDGAVLIRNTRIVAARCHVPLSDTVHTLVNYGTRHRAAVGASEMGDAVAIAVSEERGKVSLAVRGCLYEMKNGEDLRKNLLGIFGMNSVASRFVRRIRYERNSLRKKTSDREDSLDTSPAMDSSAKSDTFRTVSEKADMMSSTGICTVSPADKSPTKKKPLFHLFSTGKTTSTYNRMNTSHKILYILLSFLISLGLWMYIQINSNPVVEKSLSVPLFFKSESVLEENGLETNYNYNSVNIRIVGRKNVIDNLQSADMIASIDYSQITGPGVYYIPIDISSEKNVYYRLESQDPESISVVIYPQTLT
ncbi:MAG: TIGR00159 family protein [Clostridiaceae bacterium]|nr:TIGR00159 family protein [Clostridiaceae bacterium]